MQTVGASFLKKRIFFFRTFSTRYLTCPWDLYRGSPGRCDPCIDVVQWMDEVERKAARLNALLHSV